MRKFLTLLPVLMLLCALAYGQTHTVTGIVRDDKGSPIPFATVTIAGTNTATQADANGKFSINANKGATLLITAVNFKEERVSIGDRSAYDVRMNTSLSTMDEVIVTARGIKA